MFLSIIAVYLTQQNTYPEIIKYAPVVGLMSQPFWLYMSLNARQWGVFVSSIIYTFVWMLGIYNNFL